MKKFNRYDTGYDPEAIEHDLRVMSRLSNGKKTLTNRRAQEIYREIKAKNIEFRSSKGEEFLTNVLRNITDAQREEIERRARSSKRRKRAAKRLISINRKIAIVMSVAVLLSCVVFVNWNLLMDLRTNYEARKLREKISVPASDDGTEELILNTEKDDELPEEEGKNQGEQAVLSKFTALYEENNDFAGWLYIEGTKINYPVMSRDGDNNYYLDKNFNGQEDKNGLLILDYRSNAQESGKNIIIYGHNIRTGVMFGTLGNYKDKAFGLEHQTIAFDSLYDEGKYKLVAAMLSAVAYEDEDVFRYYDAVDISTQESFDEFKENIESNALYTTDEYLEYGDTCLILSTCDYYTDDGRFVVVAKKIN